MCRQRDARERRESGGEEGKVGVQGRHHLVALSRSLSLSRAHSLSLANQEDASLVAPSLADSHS